MRTKWFALLAVWVLLNCETSKRNDKECAVGEDCPEQTCQEYRMEEVSTPSAVLAISAGDGYSCAIIDAGKLKCWGLKVEHLGHGCSYRTGSTAHMYDLPIDLGAGRSAKNISTGRSHICAILDNDKVKCWGYRSLIGSGKDGDDIVGDEPGEMGDDLPIVELGTHYIVKSIDIGSSHTCAIISDGKVKCWGDGGLLGLGHAKSMGNAPNEMGDNLPAVDLGTGRTAKAISVGSNHTCAILDNDAVKCWGDGQSGQLGLGKTPDERSVFHHPILNAVPPPSYYYIGDEEGEMGNNLLAVDLGTGRTAKAISAGDRHTCVLLDNDTVKCWGNGHGGQLGQGSIDNWGDTAGEMGNNLPAVDLGTGRTAKAISAGGSHTCVLLDNDTVKCWGIGGDGQLGQGSIENWGDTAGEMGNNLPAIDLGTGRTAKAISAGDRHTCVLLDNDTVKCWGNGHGGQFGHMPTSGNTTNRVAIGDEAEEMGDNLSPIAL